MAQKATETPGTIAAGALVDAAQRLVVVIPAYNEERFIGSMVIGARRHAESVIVVDDGSSDQTAEIAAAAGAIVVRHEHNRGKGVALNSGLARARELDPDAVVVLDADGQHLAREIPQVAEPALRGEADIVVGSRYLEDRSDVPRHRIWGHRVFNLLTRHASGVEVSDSQSGFRAFSRRAYAAMSFRSDGFSVESEMQFVARERNLQVVEVPITVRYDDRPKRPVIFHGLGVVNGILRMIGQYRPLLFLGLPGFAVLLVGLAWGIWVVEIYRASQQLALGYALISVMLSVIGTLAFSTGIILHSVRGLLLDLLGPKGY